MSAVSRSLTYDDLERARETSADRFELIEGELFVTPAPALRHQDILGNLYVPMRQAVQDPGLGRVYLAPVDVRLAEHTIVQPDLVVVLGDRSRILGQLRIDGAPSLIVEIASPSTSTRDLGIKRDLYARHGVPEYWFTDTDARTMTIFSNPRDGRYHGETVATDVAVSVTIPGVSVDLAALFAVPGL
jgi:Uma2 family endonuclease